MQKTSFGAIGNLFASVGKAIYKVAKAGVKAISKVIEQVVDKIVDKGVDAGTSILSGTMKNIVIVGASVGSLVVLGIIAYIFIKMRRQNRQNEEINAVLLVRVSTPFSQLTTTVEPTSNSKFAHNMLFTTCCSLAFLSLIVVIVVRDRPETKDITWLPWFLGSLSLMFLIFAAIVNALNKIKEERLLEEVQNDE